MSLGFGDVRCMQAFNVYFPDSFFFVCVCVLWRSVLYYERTCTDIMLARKQH